MRILADACIAGSLVQALRAANNDVLYMMEGPPGVDDAEILENAKKDHRLLLTEDHDFGALALRDGRASAGVVLIELHGLSAAARDARVLSVLGAGESLLLGQFTVIEPSRTRSRPLDPG
jgi:predicted nuclease of predicted toxin-antitoxin system